MTTLRRFVAVAIVLLSAAALAAVSSKTVPSPLAMSAHNVSFDGRLFVGRGANVWDVKVLRPERIAVENGLPDLTAAFSARVEIDPNPNGLLNALALCEETTQPYACARDGSASASGGFDCYDEVVIYSPAFPDQAGMPSAAVPNMVRRRLLVVVSAPRTADAAIARLPLWSWSMVQYDGSEDHRSMVSARATRTRTRTLRLTQASTQRLSRQPRGSLERFGACAWAVPGRAWAWHGLLGLRSTRCEIDASTRRTGPGRDHPVNFERDGLGLRPRAAARRRRLADRLSLQVGRSLDAAGALSRGLSRRLAGRRVLEASASLPLRSRGLVPRAAGAGSGPPVGRADPGPGGIDGDISARSGGPLGLGRVRVTLLPATEFLSFRGHG